MSSWRPTTPASTSTTWPSPATRVESLTRNRLARQYIPIHHYFVMGEERVNKETSEHFGIHPVDTLERAQ